MTHIRLLFNKEGHAVSGCDPGSEDPTGPDAMAECCRRRGSKTGIIMLRETRHVKGETVSQGAKKCWFCNAVLQGTVTRKRRL